MNYRQRLSQGIHCLVTIIDIFYKHYLYSGHAETFFWPGIQHIILNTPNYLKLYYQ